MDSYTLLIFGCFVGMQHALEADHLAAVAALSARRGSRRALVLRGSAWGLGHTITLLAVCGLLLALGESLSDSTIALLEFCVGVMILGLGGKVIWTLIRRRVHFHVHRHGSDLPHVHAHAHVDAANPLAAGVHHHEHQHLGLGPALVIGMVHGAAGSAGLLVLTAAADSLSQAAGYVLAFGCGSIIGMATLSFIASYPLRLMERYANWLNTAAFVSVGFVAIVIGGNLMGESWSGFWL